MGGLVIEAKFDVLLSPSARFGAEKRVCSNLCLRVGAEVNRGCHVMGVFRAAGVFDNYFESTSAAHVRDVPDDVEIGCLSWHLNVRNNEIPY